MLLSKNSTLFDTLFVTAFSFATCKAFGLISLAVTDTLSLYFATDTAIAPEPVHKSKTCLNLFSFMNFVACSTINSVSGLGIKTSGLTLNISPINSELPKI